MLSRLVPFLAALFVALALPQAKAEEPAATLDPAERAAFEAVIRDYLMAHPEVIIDAVKGLQERQRQEALARQQEAVAAAGEELRSDPTAPVMGNPDGDVVVVEFFDYQCGYCKAVAPQLREAVAKDGRIKLVMKEFPILGPASHVASRVALAATRQGKYEPFHWNMMLHKGPLDEAAIFAVAEASGLDVARLREDMQDPEIERVIARNLELADRLGVNGTPAFVIGDRFAPGALPMEQFRAYVAEARAKGS